MMVWSMQNIMKKQVNGDFKNEEAPTVRSGLLTSEK